MDINRGLIVVRPKQPYVDWANNCDYAPTKTTLADIRDDANAYLVPCWEDDIEFELILRKICGFILLINGCGSNNHCSGHCFAIGIECGAQSPNTHAWAPGSRRDNSGSVQKSHLVLTFAVDGRIHRISGISMYAPTHRPGCEP